MSRSGYSDGWDCENWELNLSQGALWSAIRGKRGQAFLKSFVVALDDLKEKRLAKWSLISPEGNFCSIGALCNSKGIDLTALNEVDQDDEVEEVLAEIHGHFDVAKRLIREIIYENDEFSAFQKSEEDEEFLRFQYMRNWAIEKINDPEFVANLQASEAL